MSLASQLVSFCYLMLLGLIWGFLWELLEELSKDPQKGAVLLFIFMLPISGVIWYLSNGGAFRYYVPISVVLGVLIFSFISKQTIGATLALCLKRILGSIGLLFSIFWLLLRLGMESIALIMYAICRRFSFRKKMPLNSIRS
ncbi:MAG TPA: hypothetical protein GX522_01060 [Firmicutes bacterium]|nr:hypothetical protein [Bacillota bacterium]